MRILFFTILAFFSIACNAQTANDVILLKNTNNDKWGYASKQQNSKSPIRGLRKTAINVLGKTGQSVLASGETELIDWVIPAQYDAAATDFEENLAAVEVGGKVGFIDLHNRFIIEPKYEPMKHLEGFSQGLAAVKVGDKYGYIDKRGKMVIQPQYDLARNFRDNLLATVKMNGKFGAIDITGKLVVECKYIAEEAMTTVPISNKEYREAAKASKLLKDNDGYAHVTDALQAVSREVNKRIDDSTWVQKLSYETCGNDSLHGIQDNYRRVIIPAIYEEITHDAANHVYIVKNQRWYDTPRYGVYTDKGDLVFRPVFDAIGPFSNGKATATINGIDGWIEKNGLVEPTFMDKLCDDGLNADTGGNKRKARQTYNRILTLNPEHVMALNNLALLDFEAKDYNDGMRRLKQAHKLAPDNKLIADNLEMAKQDRKERRWNRINGAMKAVVAVVGVAGSAYAISAGGSEGMKAASSMMKSTEETLAVLNGEEPSAIDADNTGFADMPDFTGEVTTMEPAAAESKGNKLPEHFYTDTYARWERNAKSCYDSLTLLGARGKDKHGNDTGGTAAGSWSGGKFSAMKSELRKAQQEMRKTRAEARKAGYTIPQSNYETINVSY